MEVIRVDNISKKYGSVQATSKLSLNVRIAAQSHFSIINLHPNSSNGIKSVIW